MQRSLVVVFLVMFSAAAAAADTIRIGDRIVMTGMSTADVIDRAGKPSRIVQLENGYGAGVGERWEYYRGRKQYNVWMAGGKVTRVDEL